LFLTAPSQLAAGSSTQLYARLLFADQIQYEDVTGSATWTVTPSAAGSFPQPGLFLAGNVTSETAATLTCQYVFNGQVYTAQLTTKVIPAVAQGITVSINAGDATENGEKAPSTLSDLLKGLPCGLPAILLIGFLAMSGLRLTRPE